MNHHESLVSAAETAMQAPSDQSLRVPCYCEENVWRLVYRKLHTPNGDSDVEYYVVFISNPLKCVPMFHQLASTNASRPCYWDYHVILISHSKVDHSLSLVFDMDSRLPFPCSLDVYLTNAFPPNIEWPEQYLPFFRVVPAQVFLETFSSDRMHMYNPLTQEWSAEPPTYACILPSKSNLVKYMIIEEKEIKGRRRVDAAFDSPSPFGTVVTLLELRRHFEIDPPEEQTDIDDS